MFFWIVVLLLFLGVFLILLEVIVPHGLSMIAGFAVIIFSTYYCYQNVSPQMAVAYMIFALMLATFSAYTVFRWGIRTMSLKPLDPPAHHGDHAPPCPEPRIGERVHVSQPLRPTGAVEFGGVRWPARSFRPESEFAIGEELEVRGRDSSYLVVDRVAGENRVEQKQA